MNDAICELKIALETAETNGPIYEAEGNMVMAERCRERATCFREAIAKLEG
jgi:hypothetical protein